MFDRAHQEHHVLVRRHRQMCLGDSSVERQIDVTVFWCDEKTFDDDKTTYKPQREELCSISIKDIKEFLMGGRCGKVWDYVDKVWKKTTGNKIFPGQTIMLKDSDGGYTETLGWYATSVDKVKTISGELRPVLHGAEPDSHASDSSSKLAIRVTLEDHTRHVMQETDQFLETIPYLNKDVKNAIRMAAKYHDVGKIHKVFQNATGGNRDEVLAKSPGMSNYDRFGFRHEVASTLLYLKQNNGGGNFVNLTAYLIMAHHGKVRFTLRRVYRSHARLDKKYLLGIEISGETMKEFSSNSVSVPETFIDMRMAAVGRGPNNEPSWTERVMELLDEYGPFKLAYLEALIRRADWFASEKENDGRYGEDGR